MNLVEYYKGSTSAMAQSFRYFTALIEMNADHVSHQFRHKFGKYILYKVQMASLYLLT